MAKQQASEDGQAAKPIDEDTLKVLDDQVKKGKQRKFVLICKGAQIRKLVVFRVGPYKTQINKARQEGFRGEAVCGAIVGSGKQLRFRLAGSDAVSREMGLKETFVKAPTKKAKLRDFLLKNKLTKKPEYEIVASLEQFNNPKSAGPQATGGASV